MAIEITSVTGLNGDPPTVIHIAGSVSGCKRFTVKTSCSDRQKTVEVTQDQGETDWSVDMPNDKGCPCNKDIVITAQCLDDVQDQTQTSKILDCTQCPAVTGSATVGDCDANGNRPVHFSLSFDPPIPQGATAQVLWSFGGPNAQGQTTATDTLPTASGPVHHFARDTDMPPHPASGSPNSCSYFPSAGVTVVVNGEVCSIVPVDFCVVVDACLPCPGDPSHNLPPAALSIVTPSTWCAPPQTGQAASFTATVNFPAGTPTPPTPSEFDWAVQTPGGLTFLLQSSNASVTTASGWQLNGAGPSGGVDLSQPGQYAVSVAVKFPPDANLPTAPDGTPSCNVSAASSFSLDACSGPATCPSITSLEVTPACADPAAGLSANVSFTVQTSDPSGLISGFRWDFGDPNSGGANHANTATPTATHSYSRTGNFTVTVTARVRSGCEGGGPTTATTLVAVPFCPCPPGQTRNARGQCVAPATETLGCMVLRELAAALSALALVAVLVAFCFFWPPAIPFWIAIGVAAGLTIAAGILFAFWFFSNCPRPCGWGLLLAGQIFLGVGWGAVYFFLCCPWLGWTGIVVLAIAVGLLVGWYNECHPGLCAVAVELGWVLTVVVPPVLSFIMLYPPAHVCAVDDPVGGAISAGLTVVAALVDAVVLGCAGTQQRRG